MADKDLPPNMLAEFAEGSGADDKRTKGHADEKAKLKERKEPEMSELDKALAEQLEKEAEDKKSKRKCAEFADDTQAAVRGLGDQGHPQDYLKRADHPGTGSMDRDDSSYLQRTDDQSYLSAADRF